MASSGKSYPKLDKCVKKRINSLRIKDHECFNIIQTNDLLLRLKSVLPNTRLEEIERKYDREGNISALNALLDTMVKHGDYAVNFLEFLVSNNQRALAELVMKNVKISEIDNDVPNFIRQLVICDDFSSLPPSYDQIDYDQAEAYRKYRYHSSDQIAANTAIDNDVDTCISVSHPSNVTLLDQNILTSEGTTLSAPPPLHNPVAVFHQNTSSTTRSTSINPPYVSSTPISKDPTSIANNSQQNHPLHVVVPSNNSEATALYPAVDVPLNPIPTLQSKPNLSTIVERSGHYIGPEQQKFEIPHYDNRSPLDLDRPMKESHTEGQLDREETIPKDLFSKIPTERANDRGKFEGNGEKTKIGKKENGSAQYKPTSYSFETTIVPNEGYQATQWQHATQIWTDERKGQISGIKSSEVCISSSIFSEKNQFPARVDMIKIKGEHIENEEIPPNIPKQSSMKSEENEKEILLEENQVHVQETMEQVDDVESAESPIFPEDKKLIQIEKDPAQDQVNIKQFKSLEEEDQDVDLVQNRHSTKVEHNSTNKLKNDIAVENLDSTNVEMLISQGRNTDENGNSPETPEKIGIDKCENMELPHQTLNENSTTLSNVAVGLLAVSTMVASWVFK